MAARIGKPPQVNKIRREREITAPAADMALSHRPKPFACEAGIAVITLELDEGQAWAWQDAELDRCAVEQTLLVWPLRWRPFSQQQVKLSSVRVTSPQRVHLNLTDHLDTAEQCTSLQRLPTFRFK